MFGEGSGRGALAGPWSAGEDRDVWVGYGLGHRMMDVVSGTTKVAKLCESLVK